MASVSKSESLELFVDKLLQEKQLPELDPEVLSQLRDDLLSRVEDRINAELLSRMTPDQAQEFSSKLDQNMTDADIQLYLRNTIPDMDEALATALIKFRATYLGLNNE